MRKYLTPLFVALGILALPLSARLLAEVPRLINYQGKLTDLLGGPVNQETEMTFALYTGPAGGEAIWTETQSVAVTEGIFNVLLGNVNPLTPEYFLDHPETYLGVKVGLDAEMLPRQELASAAYAMRAEIADSISPAERLSILEVVYPIGAIYISTLSTNPADLLGFGIWSSFGAGRVLVGYDGSDAAFNAGEKIGGAQAFNNSHYHNASDLRAAIGAVNSNAGSIGYQAAGAISGVSYTYAISSGNISISHINHSTPVYGTTDSQQSGSQSLLQPYITVYTWRRTG